MWGECVLEESSRKKEVMLNERQYLRLSVKELLRKVLVGIVLGVALIGGSFGGSAETARAVPNDPNMPSMPGLIYSVFGPYGGAAVRVAQCESGLNPNATNPFSIGGSRAAGLFQILYPSTWASTAQRAFSPYDARANTLAAHEIFVRDGYSWREWSCQP